jgi:hypothetical protein
MSVTLCTEDIRPLVEKLVAAYPNNLQEVDPNRLIYVKGNGKKRPVSLSPVKPPYDSLLSQRFILTIHAPKFDKLDDNRKAIAIFDELIRIKDFETGSLKSHSVVGNFETFSTWGLDWLEAEETASAFPVEQVKKKA